MERIIELRTFSEKYLKKRDDIFVAFMDLENVYDGVDIRGMRGG